MVTNRDSLYDYVIHFSLRVVTMVRLFKQDQEKGINRGISLTSERTSTSTRCYYRSVKANIGLRALCSGCPQQSTRLRVAGLPLLTGRELLSFRTLSGMHKKLTLQSIRFLVSMLRLVIANMSVVLGSSESVYILYRSLKPGPRPPLVHGTTRSS